MEISKTDKKDEILKYIYAKISQTKELLKEKINYNSKPFPLRKTSIKLQEYAKSFIKESEERIIILPGLRGTGKTTMVLQLYDFLVNESKFPEERVLYFSTDELKEYLGVSVSEMLEVYFEDVIKSTPVFLKEKVFILIDEAHFEENWDRIAKILYDQSKNIFIAITGSSALSMEISPDLARRSIKEKVYPLSFSEYLLLKYNIKTDLSDSLKSLIFKADIKKISKKEIEILKYSSKINKEINQEFLSYLTHKDMPFGLNIDEKSVYAKLNSMIDRIIDKDVFSIQSFKSESKETIKRIISFIASQHSGGTSDSKLAGYLETSSKQIRNILDVLEKTHLIFSVKPYGGAGRIVRKPWKYYFLSLSMMASIRYSLGLFDKTNKDILGILLENMVAFYLIKMKETMNFGMFYDASDGGVDFVIQDNEKIIPIEVGYGKKDKGQLERAIKKYKSKYGILICGCSKINKEGKIIYLPFTTFSFV